MISPTELAREALRQLAVRRIAPTPEHFRLCYYEVAGIPAELTPLDLLRDFTGQLSKILPQNKFPIAALEQAIELEDWKKGAQLLQQITRDLDRQFNSADATPTADDAGGAQLRELLAKTLEFSLNEGLGYPVTLVQQAREVAGALRAGGGQSGLEETAGRLKKLWLAIEFNAHQTDAQEDHLRRLLTMLLENIGELVPESSWLAGQLRLVRDVIVAPADSERLIEAEKRLREIIYKQSMAKHGLQEATETLKQTMKNFVSRLGEILETTGDYEKKMQVYVEKISSTESVQELGGILDDILQDTRTMQLDTTRSRDELLKEREAAEQAEARILQLEMELAHMSTLVYEDGLTGGLNRRGLENHFVQEAARADRENTPLCLAMLDIDDFKKLNDTYGHDVGDDALVHLANSTREVLRNSDMLARYGGEEFVILMPNTLPRDAVQVTNRVRRALTKKIFLHENKKLFITFSAGIAERRPGETLELLTKRADMALYRAKEDGKNRIYMAE